MEIELKLSLPETALKALLDHPLIASAALYQKKHKLMNTYYDTPALDLHRARIAVRTRQAGRKWLQTIKCASASVGGLSSRPEWEQPYQNKRFDFTAVSDQPTRLLLEKHADQIIPVFTTNFHRETRLLEPDADTRILLMIDHGHIEAQDKNSPICEIELELVQGNPMQLFDLALCLAAELPLLPEDVSKAERGYRLFLDTPTQAARIQYVEPHAQQTPLEAFRELSFAALQAWQSNTSGILASDHRDTSRSTTLEFISGYYDSIEQLRFLLKIFASVLSKKFVKHWRGILRELSKQSLPAHQLLGLQQYLLTHPELCANPILHGHIAAHQTEAIDTLRQHLQHNGLLMLAYSQALYSIDPASAEQDMNSFVQQTLNRLSKKAWKIYDKKLKQPSEKFPFSRLLAAFKHLKDSQDIFSSLHSDDGESVRWLAQKITPVMEMSALLASKQALGFLKETRCSAEYQQLQQTLKARLKDLKTSFHSDRTTQTNPHH